ncbi:MAG: 4Fe-4S dicluster domain-containing protein [Desulfurococcaceae archaeon]
MSSNPVIKYIRIIDLGKCIGCGACEAACEFIHGKPYIIVHRTSIGLDIPVSCMHCAKAPCIEACPTGAMTRDSAGAVHVITSRCIGCMACLYACPFGIPELDRATKTASKCNLCMELRKEGLEPACSAICPANAILYGEDAVVFQLAKKRVAETMAKARFEYELHG